MRDQLAELKQEAEARSAHAPAQHAAPADIQTEYTRRVQAWLEGLNPVQRGRRYTADEIVLLAGLEGLGGMAKGPRLGMVGTALRVCGMIPRRDWTAAGRNRRYWGMEGQ